VDISELKPDQLLLAVGAGCFIVGCILAKLVGGSAGRNSAQEDPRNHKIRELEVDLRTTRRQLAEREQTLEQKALEFSASVATLQELRTTIGARDKRIGDLEIDLHASIAKTNELRRELQDRAVETVREQVRAEEAVTELEVERAGSEAVMTEITRLQQERQRLSATMQKMGGSLLLDEELFGSES
jgi:chromosome segregation ATPase